MEGDASEPDVILPPDPEVEAFYEGAYVRMARIMLVIAVLASLAGWLRFDWRVGAGVAVGCAVAAVNFLWMKRAITAFAGRMAESPPQPSAADPDAESGAESGRKMRGSATRFAVRYALVGAV